MPQMSVHGQSVPGHPEDDGTRESDGTATEQAEQRSKESRKASCCLQLVCAVASPRLALLPWDLDFFATLVLLHEARHSLVLDVLGKLHAREERQHH